MFRKYLLFTFFSLVLLLPAGCVPLLGTIEVGIETPLPQTEVTVVTQEPDLGDGTTPTPEVVETPTSDLSPGVVSGRVCFPSEQLPAMTLFFEQTETRELIPVGIDENQTAYTAELPAGPYVAFAYPNNDTGFGGMYSQAVPCGLSVGCADHALLAFEVPAGGGVSGIDICDWYSPVDVPPHPEAVETAPPEVAGLIYKHNNSIWRVGVDGRALPVLNSWDAVISSDGLYAAYASNDDIWVANLESGEKWNVTNSPTRIESFPQWVPSTRPALLFASRESDEELGLSAGYLTVVGLDGTGYRVLENTVTYFDADASPDGQAIAYSTFDAGWIYRVGGEVEFFDASAFGLDTLEKFGALAWSPDGNKLAWWALGNFGPAGESQWGIVIFDLASRTARVLHAYTPIGGSPSPSPVWSPDGVWIAGHVLGEGSKGAFWAMRADGSEEINLGNGGDFTWRPDGGALVVSMWPEDGSAFDSTLAIIEVGPWHSRDLGMPPGSFPLVWLESE